MKPTRIPTILGWGAFATVLIILGPIAFAVVTIDSRPGGGGADPAAKALIGLFVLSTAAIMGLAARTVARFALGLRRKR